MKRSLVEEVENDLNETEAWKWIRDANTLYHDEKQYKITMMDDTSKSYLEGMEKLFTAEDASRLYKFIRNQIKSHEDFIAEQKLRRKKERLRRLFPNLTLDLDHIKPS